MKNVTLKDVARAAGVSYATVSRALSENAPINGETRKKILEICDEMGYTRDFIARSMVRGKTEVLGLIVPTIANEFMSETAYYAEEAARKRGYNIMLCNSDPGLEQELVQVKLMIGRKVDGILIVPQSSASYDNIRRFSEQIPMVFLSENLRDEPQSYVTVDNTRGAVLATEYLCRLGHRRILYFGKRKSTTHQLRADGYMKACSDLGIEPHVLTSEYRRSSIEYGYKMAQEMFQRHFPYTAIFASTDSNALGIMKAAEEAGISIPGDISLIGFDNIKGAAFPRIELTTIDQPKEEMAVRAVDIMLDSIEKRTESYTHQILIPTLIERKTCRSVQ